jgi:SnoaL-like domain
VKNKNRSAAAANGLIFVNHFSCLTRCFALGASSSTSQGMPVVSASRMAATIFTLTGDQRTGEAYCLAHHVTVNGERRHLMIASLRYRDTYVKIDGAWLFAERMLYVDWLEERVL